MPMRGMDRATGKRRGGLVLACAGLVGAASSLSAQELPTDAPLPRPTVGVQFCVRANTLESMGGAALQDTLRALARSVSASANEVLPIFSWVPSSTEPYRLVVTLVEKEPLGVLSWLLSYAVVRPTTTEGPEGGLGSERPSCPDSTATDRLQDKPSSDRLTWQGPPPPRVVFVTVDSLMRTSLDRSGETQFEQDLQKSLLSGIPLDTVQVGDRVQVHYDLTPFPANAGSFLRLLGLRPGGEPFPVSLLKVGPDFRAPAEENGLGIVRFRNCVLKASAWYPRGTYDWTATYDPTRIISFDSVRADLREAGAQAAVLTWGFYKKGEVPRCVTF
jgi:hypothetical protein